MTRMISFLSFVSILLASAVWAKHAPSSRLFKSRHEQFTNSERFARGLPPLKPRKLYQGYSGFTKRQTLVGAIDVTFADGTTGYVADDGAGNGLYYFTTDPTHALIVSVDAGTTQPTDIVTLNGNPTYNCLGAIEGQFASNADLEMGSPNYVYIGATNPTPVGSPPMNVGNSYSEATGIQEPSESAIWFLNPTTLQFSYTYVDPPGSKNATSNLQLVYYSAYPNFAITADLAAYQNAYGDGATVTFSLDTSIHP